MLVGGIYMNPRLSAHFVAFSTAAFQQPNCLFETVGLDSYGTAFSYKVRKLPRSSQECLNGVRLSTRHIITNSIDSRLQVRPPFALASPARLLAQSSPASRAPSSPEDAILCVPHTQIRPRIRGSQVCALLLAIRLASQAPSASVSHENGRHIPAAHVSPSLQRRRREIDGRKSSGMPARVQCGGSERAGTARCRRADWKSPESPSRAPGWILPQRAHGFRCARLLHTARAAATESAIWRWRAPWYSGGTRDVRTAPASAEQEPLCACCHSTSMSHKISCSTGCIIPKLRLSRFTGVYNLEYYLKDIIPDKTHRTGSTLNRTLWIIPQTIPIFRGMFFFPGLRDPIDLLDL
ncbi:hypothetical protein C8R44DRAFT_736312 [Mycena epipterygia]|nr:hypothetical protein C8R44DRAFT_736312 [Mycena epipterygia]